MGNADSKSLEDYQLRALLEEAAAPVDSCYNDEEDTGAAAAGHNKHLVGRKGREGGGGSATGEGSRLRRLLEANLSPKDIAAVVGSREEIQHLVTRCSQALLCLLDQLIALVSATADAASQGPITPAQSSTLLTALRLLTLLLPVLLENRELEHLLFWTPHPRCPRACSGGSGGAMSSSSGSSLSGSSSSTSTSTGSSSGGGSGSNNSSSGSSNSSGRHASGGVVPASPMLQEDAKKVEDDLGVGHDDGGGGDYEQQKQQQQQYQQQQQHLLQHPQEDDEEEEEEDDEKREQEQEEEEADEEGEGSGNMRDERNRDQKGFGRVEKRRGHHESFPLNTTEVGIGRRRQEGGYINAGAGGAAAGSSTGSGGAGGGSGGGEGGSRGRGSGNSGEQRGKTVITGGEGVSDPCVYGGEEAAVFVAGSMKGEGGGNSTSRMGERNTVASGHDGGNGRVGGGVDLQQQRRRRDEDKHHQRQHNTTPVTPTTTTPITTSTTNKLDISGEVGTRRQDASTTAAVLVGDSQRSNKGLPKGSHSMTHSQDTAHRSIDESEAAKGGGEGETEGREGEGESERGEGGSSSSSHGGSGGGGGGDGGGGTAAAGATKGREAGGGDGGGGGRIQKRSTDGLPAGGVTGLMRRSSSTTTTTVGQDMLNQLFRLLFLPGFTVMTPGYRLFATEGPDTAAIGGDELLARLPRHKLDITLLWRAGIGATEADLPLALTRVPPWMLSNRVEVIHCLLACFAGPLYESLDEYQLHVPQWVRLATAGNIPYTANLFCSLLSTACAAEGVTSTRMLGGLFASTEVQQLTTAVVQLLIVLLDFNVSVFVHPDGSGRGAGGGGGPRGPNGPPLRNVFRSMVAGLQREEEFDYIFEGIAKHLEVAAARCCKGGNRAVGTGPRGKPGLLAAARRCASGLIVRADGFCVTAQGGQSNSHSNFLRYICAKRGAHHLLHPLVCLLLDASRYMHRNRPAAQQRKTGDDSTPNSSSTGNKERATPLSAGGGSDEGYQFALQTHGGGAAAGGGGGAPTDEQATSSGEAASALSMIGLLHVSSFILLVLSSERDFAVRLNEPFTGKKIPSDLPVFNGTYADVLCLTVHRVIMDATGESNKAVKVIMDARGSSVSADEENDSIALKESRGSLESLVDMLLTVLCNVSAYVKSFCLESCMRLMNLMEKLSRRQWLLASPQHHHDVSFLLDIFNNIIQYQYEGNRQLVYSILRHKQLFIDLQNMTLEGTERTEMSEWSRRERAGNTSGGSTSSSAGGDPRGDGDGSVLNGFAGAQSSSCTASNTESLKRKEAAAEESQGKGGGWNRVATDDDADEPWVPTEAWFDEWKSRLPLQTILRLIKCLLPQVEAEVARREATHQRDILEFLEKTTMVGLLPVPHPIIIRNYQPNVYTALWFTSFMWGVLLAACPALQGVNWREIRLIVVYP